jgi:hypothetical protein
LVRVTTAAAVLFAVLLWIALPVSAGDPLGEVKEFTAGLTPDNGPNRIAAGPDGTPNSAPVGIAAGPDANL